jgi:hypothetical protein
MIVPKPYTDADIIFDGSEAILLPDDPSSSIRSLFLDLGAHSWPLLTSSFPSEGIHLAIALSTGTAVAVCDGSYSPTRSLHLASAAWILYDTHTGQNCRGATRVCGDMDVITAYRAELQGLHAILLATWVICQRHSLTTGSLKIACDNLESIKQSSNPHPDPVAALKNADLIRSIRCIVIIRVNRDKYFLPEVE